MSKTTDAPKNNKSWDEVRRDFQRDLQRIPVGRGNGKFIDFSVDGVGCELASLLMEPISWLRSKLPNLYWASFIQYMPEHKLNSPTHAHMSYSGSRTLIGRNALLDLFTADKDWMFLLTGLPCGVRGYLPERQYRTAIKDHAINRFPPIFLSYGDKFSPSRSLDITSNKCYVWFKVRILSSANGYDCNKTCPGTVPRKCCTLFESVVDTTYAYMSSVTHLKNLLQKGIGRTLYNYVVNYTNGNKGSEQDEIEWLPDNWVTVFIPGVPIIESPFYQNGLLASFGAIRGDEYQELCNWIGDVSTCVTAALGIRSINATGDWHGLGAGDELKKIVTTCTTTTEDEWKKSCLGVTTTIHDIPSLSQASSQKLNEWRTTFQSVLKYVGTNYPAWVGHYTSFAQKQEEQWADLAALLMFAWMVVPSPRLYLLSVLAFAKETDIDVDKKTKESDIDDLRNAFWSINEASNPGTILSRLLLMREGVIQHNKHSIERMTTRSGRPIIRWLMDIGFKDSSQPSKKNLYLDLELSTEGEGEHKLTQTILAAEVLGGSTASILPVWLNRPDEQTSGFLEWDTCEARQAVGDLSKGAVDHGTWVILGKEKCRILVKKDFACAGESQDGEKRVR